MTTTYQPQPQSRAELCERLADVNARAKEISRRGLSAVVGNLTYDDTHACLDFLVRCVLAADE